MNLINYILTKIKKTPDINKAVPSLDNDIDFYQKEKNIYGEERLNLQKLYEKWVVKDAWDLKNEAIPLLLGFDPEYIADKQDAGTKSNKIDELYTHANHCIDNGLLNVINNTSTNEQWKVSPSDIYKWATVSRIELPEPLVLLMEFVLSTVKRPDQVENVSQTGRKYFYDRENILGASLHVLSACPEKCLNDDNKVDPEKILNIINEKESIYFGNNLPELSLTEKIELINKWINTLN